MSDMENKKVSIDEVSINDSANAPENKTDQPTRKTNNADRPTPASHPTVTGADTVQTADCGTQVDTLIAQVRDLNDKYLRMAAELENTRRRAALDMESVARRRAMGIAEKILPVMDAIQAALAHTPDDAGIKSMARAMDSAFAQIGIVKINSVGEVLNPQFHNAIQAIEQTGDTKVAANTIIEEMQTGYMFGDVVLRTAMVVVAK